MAILFRFTLILLALSGTVLVARADRFPDFDEDAKPILRMQPGLLHYVSFHFKVRDTGIAHIAGTGAQPPQPPFWFEARPLDYDGPYYMTLRIQPGPPGHILEVIPKPLSAIIKVSHQAPTATVSSSQPTATLSSAPPSVPIIVPPKPAPTSTPAASSTEPTSDTPTGPLPANPPASPAEPSPNLTPPQDVPNTNR